MGDYADLDLAGLQLKCNEKTDETLESTRRMLEMCGEAKQVFSQPFWFFKNDQIDRFFFSTFLKFFNFMSGWNENPDVPRRPS